jgi:hypothetical protein
MAYVSGLSAHGQASAGASGEAVPQPPATSTNGPGQQQFNEGVRLLGEEKIPEATKSFQDAVAQDPDNADFHIGLTLAFAAAEKPAEAWRELRKALELDDKNAQLGPALVASWQAFGVQGLFNVGSPAAAIAKALGTADRVERHADHERWIYGFMAVNFADGKLDSVMDLRGLNRELLRETDHLTLRTDGRPWRPGHRLVSAVHTTTEYVLPEQQVQNWQELVTVERLLGLVNRKVEAKQLMNSIRQRVQDMDPNVEWNVIDESDADIIYQWHLPKTSDRPPHHELTRLLKGQSDIYRIAFATREENSMQARHDQWVDLLRSAKLVSVTDGPNEASDDRVVTAEPSPDEDSPSATFLAWDLGTNLGLATALYNARPDASGTMKITARVRLLAQMIGAELPEFPEISGNRAADQNALLRFAVKQAGSPYARAIRDRYGVGQMQLFEMGLKANLLLLIYEPGKASANSIANTIEDSAEANGIPRELWGGLVDAIRAKAGFTDIKRQVVALNRGVRGHLGEGG